MFVTNVSFSTDYKGVVFLSKIAMMLKRFEVGDKRMVLFFLSMLHLQNLYILSLVRCT